MPASNIMSGVEDLKELFEGSCPHSKNMEGAKDPKETFRGTMAHNLKDLGSIEE
jgi:hypothetical protein